MEVQNMGRPSGKHIDNDELNALVPLSPEKERELCSLSPNIFLEAARHVESCAECNGRVSEYRELTRCLSHATVSHAAPPGACCPKDIDVDWHEVAAGLWPELKTTQLLTHAALCDHCGPLLRAAASVSDDTAPQEEEFLAQLKMPSRPRVGLKGERLQPTLVPMPFWRRYLHWTILAPAIALMMIAGVLSPKPRPSPTSLSGREFLELAVRTHRQHAEENLAFDVKSDSQSTLNEWFKRKLQFPLALPTPPAAPVHELPYRLEGAQLLPVGGTTAAYIGYKMQTGPVGLMVTPVSVAVASGGVVVDYKKVSFHYRMVEGYKVVTWSLHGLTYALVSHEGNATQRSCMVCHSAMGDRDLSQTPSPLGAVGGVADSLILQ
jgi:anti-sigma factor RsiW